MFFGKYRKVFASIFLFASYEAYRRFPQEDVDTAPFIARSIQVSSISALFCFSYLLRNDDPDLTFAAGFTSFISSIYLFVIATVLVFEGQTDDLNDFKQTDTFIFISNVYTAIPKTIYHMLFASELLSNVKELVAFLTLPQNNQNSPSN